MREFILGDAKKFMSELFDGALWNDFFARSVTIITFTRFDISCENIREGGFLNWSRVSPIARSLLTEKPSLVKIILSSDVILNAVSYANIKYIIDETQNAKATCISGTSDKVFDINKKSDFEWDKWLEDFFIKNNIAYK